MPAETTIDMLIAIRNKIAKIQERINRNPTTENYYAKGFVPVVAGIIRKDVKNG